MNLEELLGKGEVQFFRAPLSSRGLGFPGLRLRDRQRVIGIASNTIEVGTSAVPPLAPVSACARAALSSSQARRLSSLAGETGAKLRHKKVPYCPMR